MLKIGAYTACCGYGDLFMILPEIERKKMPSLVLSSHYDEGTGIPRLIKALLPNVRCKFRDKHSFFGKNGSAKYYPNPLETSLRFKYRTHPNLHELICLSPKAINRIQPLKDQGKFILVHPLSLDDSKSYRYWSEIDFPLPIKVVGTWQKKSPIDGPLIGGDFFDTAQYLRSCVGMLGVDSSVMNLAKILRVPSVVIYPNEERRTRTPCYGTALVDPSPQEVSKALRRLIEPL